MNIKVIVLFTAFFVISTFSKTAEQWKSRSVYQIITDRFAKTDGDTSTCSDLNNYCGGTYKGILNNLEYIQGMGFDAIWISPIVANTPGGYHGYWTSNFYELNENFGTPEELHELIKVCHDRDIWVMVDVVANHIGYVQPLENVSKVENNDYSKVVPFNDPSHYNPHKHCDSVPQGDQAGIETCWLCDLPDLDQNNPFVRDTLLNWIADFVKQYNIDALRIDTIPHVSREFWAEFSKASGVFTVGEVLSMDLPYLARYQQALDSILNYALYSTLRYAFMNDGSMNSIQYYYDIAYSTWKDVNVLGNFVNNHDNPRFLSSSNNTQNFKAALAFSICSVGIPMVYYGDEQAFKGGMDPMNREPLWTDMNAESEIYYYLRTLNTFRKQTKFYEYEQIQRHSDNNVYAFSRGDYFFAFTNSQEIQTRTITSHPYAEGTMLCNIFQKGDCVEVMNGAFDIVMTNGDVKILSPSYGSENSGERVWDDIKLAFGAKTAFNIQGSRAF